ncbi:unnamed protein product [Diamesa serratosioi]
MRPQTASLVAGTTVMMYSGLQLGWGIFNWYVSDQDWAKLLDRSVLVHCICSWFIAAIFGLIIGAFMITKTSKIILYAIASVLAVISGVSFMFASEAVVFVFASRILGGLSHGIAYLTILIHGCEVSVGRLRGYVLTLIHTSLLTGIFMLSLINQQVYSIRSFDVSPEVIIGIIGVITVPIGMLLSFFFLHESPVYLIKQQREDEALEVLIRLRSKNKENQEIRAEFNELKQMIDEDTRNNKNFDLKHMKQLLIIILLKLSFVASFNLPINFLFMSTVGTDFYNGILRMANSLVSMFFVDINKKQLLIASVGFSGVVLLSSTTAFVSTDNFKDSLAARIIALLFQIFTGLGLGSLADIYSTEAFNTNKKPNYIAIATSIEYIVQLMLVYFTFNYDISFYAISPYAILVPSVLIMIGTAFVVWYFIPDTNHLSLREARNKFFKFY